MCSGTADKNMSHKENVGITSSRAAVQIMCSGVADKIMSNMVAI